MPVKSALRCYCVTWVVALPCFLNTPSILFAMVTRFPNADGSTTVRSNGYGSDFVAHLATHLAYLSFVLTPNTSLLDQSLASIKQLDELLTARKKELQSLPDALVVSTVAYCGEVLRKQVEGKWFLYVCPADDYGGERYFPAIQSAVGAELEFCGLIEREFERATNFHLYSRVRGLTLPALPVHKWENHLLGDDLFPPLKKAPVLRKIFPTFQK
jgi:hypothetical protein